MAADANASAQFSCSGSVWRTSLCASAYAAKVVDLSGSCGRSRLASFLIFTYAFSVKRRPRHFRYFTAKRLLRIAFALLSIAAFVCGGSALRARPQQPAKEVAPAVTKVEPPYWWVGLTPEVMLLLSGRDWEARPVGSICQCYAFHARRLRQAGIIFLSG